MPRWAWNKAPVEAKRQFFELIRQGASGQSASLARISMVLVLCRSDRHGIWNACQRSYSPGSGRRRWHLIVLSGVAICDT